MKEILKAPCVRPQHLNERNYYCMSALQLCCCDDAQGSPSTAELLVRHGADVNARCWDKTPLMAAAASEHYELVQALCEELGADPMLRNGEMMMAMDYCKTIHTSELLHGFMDGHFLMNKAAPSFVSEDDGATWRLHAHVWGRQAGCAPPCVPAAGYSSLAVLGESPDADLGLLYGRNVRAPSRT